jgi:hypothetical protein
MSSSNGLRIKVLASIGWRVLWILLMRMRLLWPRRLREVVWWIRLIGLQMKAGEARGGPPSECVR